MDKNKVYFTKVGMEKLEEAIRDHEKKVEDLYRDLGETCRDDPDLPENLLSKEIRAKFQSEIPAEKNRLMGMLAASVMIENYAEFLEKPADTVWIGSEVTYKDLVSNKSYTLSIMGALESNLDNGIITYEAPIAQAMLDKKAGDHFSIEGREGEYEIISVSRVLASEES